MRSIAMEKQIITCGMVSLFLLLTSLSSGGIAQEAAMRSEIILSLNENAFGPSPAAAKAIVSELHNVNRYIGEEADELVRLIAEKEGVGVDQVILGEILEQLGIALAIAGGSGSEFIYSVPGYPALANAAASVGGVPITSQLNGQLENDLLSIEAAVADKTKAIFLVNPHNPSGTVSEKGALHAFIDRMSQQTLVIVDEAYLEFSDDFPGRTAAVHVRDGKNVLVFRTFAKAYGLAGLSIGYAIGHPSLIGTLKQQGLGSIHGLNRLSIAAAKATLLDGAYLEATAKSIDEERSKWHEFLDAKGWRRTDSHGNFVYFDIGKPHDQVMGELRGRGIRIGRAFPPYDSWLRITIGLPEQNQYVKDAIDQLQK